MGQLDNRLGPKPRIAMELHELVSKLKSLAKELGRTPTLREFAATGVPRRQIVKHRFSEICKAADLPVNDRAKTKNIFTPPKILFIDIETSPILAHVWGLYDQNIGINQIVQDWFILSYAAKFRDSDKFFYLDQRFSENISDDEQLVLAAHHVLSESDWVVGHNLDRFDRKKLNARFIRYGLKPLTHYRTIDTLKIAKKHFAITSNRLDFLAEFLNCKNRKSEHGKFAGMKLWTECLKRNIEAFEEMEAYNKIDVLVLEEVFDKLAPWEARVNFQSHEGKIVCSCGNNEFYKNGRSVKANGVFQRYSCKKCDKDHTSKDNILDKDVRKGLLK